MEDKNLKKNKSVSLSFTMAEIIIALAIIGVIAAITLPALTMNITERLWKVQKRALLSRITNAVNALPSLNGYGKFEGTWQAEGASACINHLGQLAPDCGSKALGCGGYCDDKFTSYGEDSAAMTFVTKGLSKVLKLNNICDHEHLSDCNFPETFKTMSDVVRTTPKRLADYNEGFVKRAERSKSRPSGTNQLGKDFSNVAINTHTVGIETLNGESMVVLYNPNCTNGFTTKDLRFIVNNYYSSSGYNQHTNIFQHLSQNYNMRAYAEAHMCVTFLYDLNGKKGPNKFGKDIGAITSFYPTDTVTLSPNIGPRHAPNPTKLGDPETDSKYSMNYTKIKEACRVYDKNSRVPTPDEAKWLFINAFAWGNAEQQDQYNYSDYNTKPWNSSIVCLWADDGRSIVQNYHWLVDFRGIAYMQYGTYDGGSNSVASLACKVRCIKD